MAANAKQLVKDWIQYLKNHQIVGLQANPESGKLTYKRPVSVDDLHKFLEVKSDFSPDQITNAIHMVLAKKAQGGKPKAIQNNPTPQEPEKPAQPGNDLSTWMHYGMKPVAPKNRLASEPGKLPAPQGNKTDYNNDDISDIDYRDIPPEQENKPKALAAPEPKRKPKFRYRNKGLTEDFEDDPGAELDENDVEEVFNILVGGQDQEKEESPKTARETAIELNRMKRVIRDKMSDDQRQMLWRALNETD